MSLNLIYLLSLSVNELFVGLNRYVNVPPRTINQISTYLKTPFCVSLFYFILGCKDKKLISNNQTFYTLFLTFFFLLPLILFPVTLSLRECKSKKLISNNQTSFDLFLLSFSSLPILFHKTLSLWECKYRKLIYILHIPSQLIF